MGFKYQQYVCACTLFWGEGDAVITCKHEQSCLLTEIAFRHCHCISEAGVSSACHRSCPYDWVAITIPLAVFCLYGDLPVASSNW